MLNTLSRAIRVSGQPLGARARPQRRYSRSTRSSASYAPSSHQPSVLHFPYNENYFKNTKIVLKVDEDSGQRSLIAAENIPTPQVLMVTPYYNHVVHASLQHLYCNACHDSFALTGLGERALRSKHIKSHLYCSDACRSRSAAYDQAMAAPLRTIQKLDPDFYVSNTDAIKLVLFTLARKWTESNKTAHRPSTAGMVIKTSEEDLEGQQYQLMGAHQRPTVLKETTLAWADFALLCSMDMSERNQLLDHKRRSLWQEIDEKMRRALFDSPLMAMGVTPLDILTRDASNSFALDKYDMRSKSPSDSSSDELPADLSPTAPDSAALESSGYATFPLASYFNHNCRPNCAIGFDMNANIVVRTTRPVEAEEELTISYNSGDLMSPVRENQASKYLMRRCKKMCKEVWCFECECEEL